MSCYRCEWNSRTASRVLSVWHMILLTVARYEISTATDRKGTDVFSNVAVCSAGRNSYYSPLLALPLFPVAHSKGSTGVSHPLHPLHLSKENRQFGSKMTDSKYFTTTKKGMIHHSSIFSFLKKSVDRKMHQFRNELYIFCFIGTSPVSEWTILEISPVCFQEHDVQHSCS